MTTLLIDLQVEPTENGRIVFYSDTQDDISIILGETGPTLDDIISLLTPQFQAYGIEKAIVFGSHARGDARPQSDLDLLVIADTQVPYHQRLVEFKDIVMTWVNKYGLGIDMIVLTPQEWAETKKKRRNLASSITKEGKLIYG